MYYPLIIYSPAPKSSLTQRDSRKFQGYSTNSILRCCKCFKGFKPIPTFFRVMSSISAALYKELLADLIWNITPNYKIQRFSGLVFSSPLDLIVQAFCYSILGLYIKINIIFGKVFYTNQTQA